MYFQKAIVHHTDSNEEFSGGLPVMIPAMLFAFHLSLAMIMVAHVGIQKLKNRNQTPVIHINIPNPNAINQSPMAFNNQVYNNDLLSFAAY